MQFVSYNIQYGTGRDHVVDLARIANAVRGADVIALQEVERFSQRTGMVDQPAALAALLPGYHWVYGPGMDLNADVVAPGGGIVQQRRQFGNMLLCKTPILTARNHMLPKFGTLVQFSLQRCALEGVIATAGGRHLRVYSLHLSHLDDGDRAPQIEHLLNVHTRAFGEGPGWCGGGVNAGMTEGLPSAPMPREAVLMGDFNMKAASPLYARIVGPLSPEYGRMNGLDGFVDAWVVAGNAEGVGTTCHSGTFSTGHRIDYCFVSSEHASRIRRAWIDEDADGSDHQPIWTDIDV
jgi:endonuclease/exonuclease/phosphatase family metal-dependent hydrolase